MNRLRFLTRVPNTFVSRTTATTMSTEEVEYVEEEEDDEKMITTTRRRVSGKKRTTRPKTTSTSTPVAMTTAKRKIWTRVTIGQTPERSSKYIPIWRRLLLTTMRPSPKSVEVVTEESVETNPEDEEEEVDVHEERSSEATTQDVTSTDRIVETTNQQTDETKQQGTEMRSLMSTPLPNTFPMPAGPEDVLQKPLEKDRGFWKRFEPNRWFESIRHITNTGK